MAGYYLRIAIAITLTLSAATASAQGKYLENIREALSQMEQGEYGRAAEALSAAFALDANEPLAHLCLGTIFAHTGQPEKAAAEYRIVLAGHKDDELALYGLALSLLAQRDLAGAADQMRKIGSGPPAVSAGAVSTRSKTVDARPALAYIKAVSGAYSVASKEVAGLDDALAGQIRAMALFKAGRMSEAKEAMQEVIAAIPAAGYAEPPGIVATFIRQAPIRCTGKTPAKPIVPPSAEAAKAPKVSGITTLRADLRKAPNVKFVLFYVDEQVVAIINHQPYEYAWDTTRWANGLHTVRIVGQTADNQVVSQKSTKVVIENRGAKPVMLTGEEAEATRARIWERMKLRPSVAAAYYVLARCATAEGNPSAAVAYLEKVIAACPDYQDARALLKEAYEPRAQYRELRTGISNGEKLIALTFDDGPGPATEHILDVLREEQVKATFFVVGQMCEAYPDVLKRIHAEGHEIQSHTYSHRNLEYLPIPEIEQELFRTIAVIRDLTGQHSTLFRPPGGHHNGNVAKVGAYFGLRPVFWTVNCARYEGTKPAAMANYISATAAPGGIILMHNPEDITAAALPAAIRALKEKGYRFVTVSEMFSSR